LRPEGENRIILRSLVLSQYQRVTDRQTDMPPMAKSHSDIAERDKQQCTIWYTIGLPSF